MINAEEKINIGQLSFRIDATMRDKFTGKLRQQGTDVKEAMTRIVSAYLAGDPAATAMLEGKETAPGAGPLPAATPPNATPADAWVQTLREIFAAGHPIAIEAITRNLLAFHCLIKTDQGARDENYRLSSPDAIRQADLARAAGNAREMSDRLKGTLGADRPGAQRPGDRNKKRK
jgi:hypothetical protein